MSFIIYEDTESLPAKMHAFTYDPEKSYATKVSKHTPCRLHVGIQYLQYKHLKMKKNKHDKYRGKDDMKKFCTEIREIITDKELESFINEKNCHKCGEEFGDKNDNINNHNNNNNINNRNKVS